MRKSLMLVAVLGTLGLNQYAFAEDAAPSEPESPHTFSYNIGLTSNYIFRGTTQTGRNPAVQGGMDYSHASGFYAGIWGSNISWLSDSRLTDPNTGEDVAAYTKSSMELDLYAGYAGEFGNGPNEFDYTDWKIGAYKSWDNGVTVGAYYTDTDINSDAFTYGTVESGKEAFTAYVQKTF